MPPAKPRYRCALLDDYQNVALTLADWESLAGEVELTVFNAPLGSPEEIARALQGFDIVVLQRERTAFPRRVIEALPNLKLLISTGKRNWMLDVAAATERGIIVCGTDTTGNPTTGIAIALILELTRRVGYESERLRHGALWQSTLGVDIEGKTLGLIGLGRLGSKVATIAQALGMKVIAWSQNLTAERCASVGVALSPSKEALLAAADIVSLHVVLSPRTRGLIGAKEFALMKRSAYLINTARGPIVDENALIAALAERRIAGAGLDVFDVEPLRAEHPLRKLDNVVLSPHLGYVTAENFRTCYAGVVGNIRAFLDGKPIRQMEPA
ncbi:MAG TPA: D-2-hydroxyacid dehydrogenase family protein [Xanthobacteraceae bacterium]|nr:D-2-hydroxyacid dehydrogenase family protein [Xanthobacteraceae bacterium]